MEGWLDDQNSGGCLGWFGFRRWRPARGGRSGVVPQAIDIACRGAGAPRSSPATLRSSSRLGQWIPKPAPAIFQSSRSPGQPIKVRVWRLSRAGVSCSSCGVLVCLRSRWRQEALSKPHNLQTHAQGCISHHPIGGGNNRHRQISRHREMQRIQRA